MVAERVRARRRAFSHLGLIMLLSMLLAGLIALQGSVNRSGKRLRVVAHVGEGILRLEEALEEVAREFAGSTPPPASLWLPGPGVQVWIEPLDGTAGRSFTVFARWIRDNDHIIAVADLIRLPGGIVRVLNRRILRDALDLDEARLRQELIWLHKTELSLQSRRLEAWTAHRRAGTLRPMLDGFLSRAVESAVPPEDLERIWQDRSGSIPGAPDETEREEAP